jgi:hypothetical protein
MILVATAIDFPIENLRRNRAGARNNPASLSAFLERALLFHYFHPKWAGPCGKRETIARSRCSAFVDAREYAGRTHYGRATSVVSTDARSRRTKS